MTMTRHGRRNAATVPDDDADERDGARCLKVGLNTENRT